jgi:hypothetical protein
MPFDPTYPQDLTPIDATPMRAQLNSLKALIDAIVTVTSAVIDGVTTLPPGSPVAVSVTVTGNELHFTFDIPEGAQGPSGSDGSEGPMGPEGPQGPQGLPGEVSSSQLDAAISGTSANSNSVDFLGSSAPPDYDPWLIQAMIDKQNELIAALRRP